MFSQVSVCPWGGMHGKGGIHGSGHAWHGDMHGKGGMHGGLNVWQEACMAGGIHGRDMPDRGHAWQGVCMVC